jgi:outer membrane protein
VQGAGAPAAPGTARAPRRAAASAAERIAPGSETLEGALAKAYAANPTIGAQRANVRSTDENVPRALAGARPTVTATADVGASFTESTNNGRTTSVLTAPRGYGVQVTQSIFDGNRTSNGVRQAESQIFAAREQLRTTVQTILFNAAASYMNVLRDTAILNLQQNNVEVLEEQLRQVRDRFQVGEVTRTDVAQGEASLAGSRSQASLAESNLRTSIANFRQVVGSQPRQLAPGRPLDRLVPATLDGAIAIALNENPAVINAVHTWDAAELQVKVVEGELLPTLGLTGSASERFDTQVSGDRRFNAQVVAQLRVPIYEGGQVYARVRQAKEVAGQARIQVEVQRDQVRAQVIQAWGQLEAAKAQIVASQAQVAATETALTGVREEARVGQRTTLDVLNAQQALLNARSNLITAQRDRVVASYAVVQAIGRLDARHLALRSGRYDPKVHYDQVKGLWYGTQTPSGD